MSSWLAHYLTTVFAAAGGSPVAVGQVSESDSALALLAGQRLTLGLNTETDSALAIVSSQARALGIVAETDIAQTITVSLPGAIGQVSESDSAHWNRIRKIPGRNEHDVREIKRNSEIMICEGKVLLRVKHFEKSR